MDSLSRPPHRRKLSSATNAFSSSFSLKNPYDDVLLSNTKSFAVHDYSEIFSGSSSSIPVLDLSPLDQSDSRTSAKLDYSNIFAAFRNDDVAVPYEHLFNASSNQTKQRSPADDRSPLQEADSPANTKRSSGETSDQSVDGVKKHFNLSFNKISQVNSDLSNGKTHVAQLHAVPGFTFFVDGTPMPRKTEEEKPVTSLKREVSRTWSFSAEVEQVKSKGGLNLDKSHQSDKSQNVNEHNLKTHSSKVPSPSSRLPSLNDSMEFKRSRVSNFLSKEDASGKISSEETSPLLEEELDENSVAAVSAAALKKAVDQAQESIRIAKMIMERKTEGLRDGTKHRSKGRSKAKDKKEIRIDQEAYESKDSNDTENSRRSIGANGTYASSLRRGDKSINVENVEVEKVRENVEEAKEHREGIIRVGRHFSPSLSPSEALHFGEKIELDKQGDESNYLNQPASPPVEKGNGMKTLEQGDVIQYYTEGPEVVTELAENTFNSPQRMQESEKSVTGTSDQSQVTVIRSKISEIVTGLVGRVLNTSQITQDHGIVDQEITGKENKMIEERDNSTIDKEKFDRVKPDKKSQETEEIVNQEEVSGFISFLNEPQNLAGKEAWDQENMMKKSEYVSDCRENDDKLGKSYVGEEKEMRQIEGHLWFESEQHLKEDMEEEIRNSYPKVFSDTREAEEKVNETREPEINDNEHSHTHQGDGQTLPNELEQIEESDMHNFVYEATETIEMESNNHAKVDKTAFFQDAEEISNSLITKEEETGNSLIKKEEETSKSPGGVNESEENQSDSEEAPYEKDKYEAIDADSDDSCTTISETQEACIDGFNNGGEENEKAFQCNKDDGSVPEMHESKSAIDRNKTAELLFDLGSTEIPAADFLRRSASEENFVGSKLFDTFDDFSSDEKEDNVGVIDPNQEEELPKDDDKLRTTNESHDGSEEYASRLAEFHPSDDKITEVDFVDERHGSEQTSASDEELLSTSSHENVDELSANKSPDREEYTEDQTSEMEKVKGGLETTSNETKCVDEQDDVYSEEKSESMEAEGSVETVQNIEKCKENLSGPSAIEEKDVKENVHDFDKNEHQQRIEAIKKGREREKDRLAVERAIREARERAFAEARERAERAAVEKAAAEARQRAMAEAKEKLEKLNAEAKIRAGRAAVERATTEARERALEKAMSHKTANEAKTQTASSSRDTVLKHSFSSSDIEKIDGTNTESAQRQKARLEMHQRIMERVAKALAEKNQRDLIAQQEQAERHRISESLDSDIKRWASGKEGNLRALLSTLQYILGSESGWKPVSLTEILTTAAVKKAYRKATLYVHPDKLQQRGASIQQKYICEKVFDLLKAAWNRFNSEER